MDLTSYLLGKKAGGGGSTPSLQTKSITVTENGTQSITADSGYDGLSSVSVTTNVSGGADLSEYFETEITNNTTASSYFAFIKKMPTITIADNVTDVRNAFYSSHIKNSIKVNTVSNSVKIINSMFSQCKDLISIDFSEFDFTQVGGFTSVFSQCNSLEEIIWGVFDSSKTYGFYETFSTCASLKEMTLPVLKADNFYGAFINCYSLKRADLSNVDGSTVKNVQNMFNACQSLEHVDIRNFEFGNVTNYTNMFNNAVPANCEIIVKSQTEKDWLNTNFSRMTNVKTVAEYEASQS